MVEPYVLAAQAVRNHDLFYAQVALLNLCLELPVQTTCDAVLWESEPTFPGSQKEVLRSRHPSAGDGSSVSYRNLRGVLSGARKVRFALKGENRRLPLGLIGQKWQNVYSPR